MTVIEKIRKKSGGHILYKFYGVEDMSAAYDVKFIVENHDFLKNIFTPAPKKTTIRYLDELRLFFLAKKISDMEETVPYINTDENKAIVKDLTTTCRQYCEGFSQAPVIEYINNHFKRIFNKNGSEHTLVDVVLEFIYEHCGGINKSVWIFLADRCSQRLLGDYKIVKKILLRNNYGPTMLDKMIKIENPADLIKYRLDTVFNVLSDIILNQKNEDLNATAKKRRRTTYTTLLTA